MCDVSLALESRHESFDWDLCLGEDRRRRGWVVTALGLAHELLGAQIDDTPVANEARRLPGWLVPAVLDRWEKAERSPPPVLDELLGRGPVATFTRRWPEPITATVYFRLPFDARPRLPIQLASYVHRIAVYALARLPGHALQRWQSRQGISSRP